MPDYADEVNGVSLAEALLDAAHSQPLHPFLNCFELYHSVGTPDGPLYVVANMRQLVATLEDTADRNPGGTVTFLAAPLKSTKPEESDSAAAPQITVTVSNVQGVMGEALRLTRGSLEPWQIVNRMYDPEDTAAPAVMPPTRMLVLGVSIDAEAVTFTCGYGDPANVSVPSTTFRRSQYPGLVR